jgi:hypothetical protein
MSIDVTTDLNSDPFGLDFDLYAQAFRLLDIDPSTPDSGIDIAHTNACQQRKAPETELAEAYAVIKDPARRLLAELPYPLDCPPELLSSFYFDEETSLNDVLHMAAPFPPLTRVNFLIRSAARQSLSEQLLLALIDGHAAIDALEIYQTLQKARRQAGHPAPSLVVVRNGLENLLTAHCNIVVARADSVVALAEFVAAIRNLIETTNDRDRLNVLGSLLNASRFPSDRAIGRLHDEIKTICGALQNRPNDISSVESLAEKCRGWANLSEVLRPVERLELHQDEATFLECIRGLLTTLIRGNQLQTAQKVIDVVTEALRPFETLHSRATALLAPFEEQINSLTGEFDRAGKGSIQKRFSPLDSRRRRFAIAVLGLIVLGGASVVFLHVNNARSTAESQSLPASKSEPESLPPASQGQRYSLESVRYCHYQGERLRFVKQQVYSQDDIRAYNALANDYNSRCANYFYQDEDLRLVTGEVAAKQKLLEADAQRIVSTWPWHVERGQAASPK